MNHKRNCVLLADRHHGLRDSVRGLLETEFDTVFMVATEASLLDGADRLNPAAVVVDLSLSDGDLSGLPERVIARAPGAKVLLLSVHDERNVAESALAAGQLSFGLTGVFGRVKVGVDGTLTGPGGSTAQSTGLKAGTPG